MKLSISLTIAALVASLTLTASAHTSTRDDASAVRVVKTRHTIRDLRERTWRYQDAHGAHRWPTKYVERDTHRITKLHRIAQMWYTRLVKERKAYIYWLTHVPVVSDWPTAVNIVQRWFPGSSGWLMSCSSSEGGWGRWVPNTKGSGAGGWMQYMEGTFWGDYHAAVSYLRQKFGVIAPQQTASWYNAMGQALAAGWAYGHNRPSGKWTGYRC